MESVPVRINNVGPDWWPGESGKANEILIDLGQAKQCRLYSV